MAEKDVKDAFKNLSKARKEVDTSRKMKVGIIGTGWIAEAHIAEYKKMPDVEVIAMADLIDGKAEAFAKQFEVENVRFYKDHKELIDNEKDLDLVSICTYNRTMRSVRFMHWTTG